MKTSSLNKPESTVSLLVEEIDLSNIFSAEFELAHHQLDLSQIHALNPERYPFLLESVAKSTPIPGSDAKLGQFDILFAFPQQTIKLDQADNATAFVNQLQADFKASLVEKVVYKTPAGDTLNEVELPFKGGWFAYFSYDYAQVVEPVLDLPANQFPLAYLSRIPAAIINDHQNSKTWLIAEQNNADLLAVMKSDLGRIKPQTQPEAIEYLAATEEPPQRYIDGVNAIKEYILAGDVFQVNLSRNWQIALKPETTYLQVYRALRESNPAPFAVLANFIDAENAKNSWQLMSSSPERLVKYEAPWVETRPIAGTRKRGLTPEADKALVHELIEHPKERAEHIMLIDLERNDLGRICQPGTVEVNDLMVVETYEHVHHIVSNVRGKLRAGFSPLDIVHALFPGGTITGCPKIRCMQIVAELEQAPREAYTGSLGYINLDGSLDLNILIRTMIQHQGNHASEPQNTIEFRAGAGIVADSQADFELVETRHKAKGLLRAFAQEQKGE